MLKIPDGSWSLLTVSILSISCLGIAVSKLKLFINQESDTNQQNRKEEGHRKDEHHRKDEKDSQNNLGHKDSRNRFIDHPTDSKKVINRPDGFCFKSITRKTHRDILENVLVDSAPVAAESELKGVDSVECLLDNRKLIITADPHVAEYVFDSTQKKNNFVRRPAEDVGLQHLGMFREGLIWNNDIDEWKRIRGCFRRALNNDALHKVAQIAVEECKSIVENLLNGKCISGETIGEKSSSETRFQTRSSVARNSETATFTGTSEPQYETVRTWNFSISDRESEGSTLASNGSSPVSDSQPISTKKHHSTAGKKHHPSLNMLDVARKVTFRATLKVFFGLSGETIDNHVEENDFIAAIVQYFKAWEYFLLRPVSRYEGDLVAKHSNAVRILREHVRRLIIVVREQSRNEVHQENSEKETNIGIEKSGRKKPSSLSKDLFVTDLQKICGDDISMLEQSVLEMLLAGTDTSSVTAYYALLGIAGDENLQNELYEMKLQNESKEMETIHNDKKGPQGTYGSKMAAYSEKKEMGDYTSLLESILDETLRFKPVGPVVLREAVAADPDFPTGPIGEGTAILVHLAEMNMREKYWKTPRTFDPHRFINHNFAFSPSDTKYFFRPFGTGPKSCIGSHLGRREVLSILDCMVSNYDLKIDGIETLGSLGTHWDIANQPDKPALIRVSRRADRTPRQPRPE